MWPQSAFCLFFNSPATTELYTLSLHDALPISDRVLLPPRPGHVRVQHRRQPDHSGGLRSEEHTSELQSRLHLVCRLLLEKKKLDYGYKDKQGGFAAWRMAWSASDFGGSA